MNKDIWSYKENVPRIPDVANIQKWVLASKSGRFIPAGKNCCQHSWIILRWSRVRIMTRNPVTLIKVFLGISWEFLREKFRKSLFVLIKPFPILSASFPVTQQLSSYYSKLSTNSYPCHSNSNNPRINHILTHVTHCYFKYKGICNVIINFPKYCSVTPQNLTFLHLRRFGSYVQLE
jgi:hypothetical protein